MMTKVLRYLCFTKHRVPSVLTVTYGARTAKISHQRPASRPLIQDETAFGSIKIVKKDDARTRSLFNLGDYMCESTKTVIARARFFFHKFYNHLFWYGNIPTESFDDPDEVTSRATGVSVEIVRECTDLRYPSSTKGILKANKSVIERGELPCDSPFLAPNQSVEVTSDEESLDSTQVTSEDGTLDSTQMRSLEGTLYCALVPSEEGKHDSTKMPSKEGTLGSTQVLSEDKTLDFKEMPSEEGTLGSTQVLSEDRTLDFKEIPSEEGKHDFTKMSSKEGTLGSTQVLSEDRTLDFKEMLSEEGTLGSTQVLSEDRTLDFKEMPSEEGTLGSTQMLSEDRTLDFKEMPSEEGTLGSTQVLSEDRTLDFKEMPSEEGKHDSTKMPSKEGTLDFKGMPSEEGTLGSTQVLSEDRTLDFKEMPSEEGTLVSTQVFSEDRTLGSTEMPSEEGTLDSALVPSQEWIHDSTKMPSKKGPLGSTQVTSEDGTLDSTQMRWEEGALDSDSTRVTSEDGTLNSTQDLKIDEECSEEVQKEKNLEFERRWSSRIKNQRKVYYGGKPRRKTVNQELPDTGQSSSNSNKVVKWFTKYEDRYGLRICENACLFESDCITCSPVNRRATRAATNHSVKNDGEAEVQNSGVWETRRRLSERKKRPRRAFSPTDDPRSTKGLLLVGPVCSGLRFVRENQSDQSSSNLLDIVSVELEDGDGGTLIRRKTYAL
uniref:Calcium-binding and spermatid-specific protein 1 n=1 Tax=Angiostrongylus cantonensis TaxID=6313 RepID=A0A0K0DKL8_ANGCA